VVGRRSDKVRELPIIGGWVSVVERHSTVIGERASEAEGCPPIIGGRCSGSFPRNGKAGGDDAVRRLKS
jgi:hypothetical protein